MNAHLYTLNQVNCRANPLCYATAPLSLVCERGAKEVACFHKKREVAVLMLANASPLRFVILHLVYGSLLQLCNNMYQHLIKITVEITEKMLCSLQGNNMRSAWIGMEGVCSALAADIPSLSEAFVIDCAMFKEFVIV